MHELADASETRDVVTGPVTRGTAHASPAHLLFHRYHHRTPPPERLDRRFDADS
jgi:hypothetical protein